MNHDSRPGDMHQIDTDDDLAHLMLGWVLIAMVVASIGLIGWRVM
jgi:hypothetical protein